MTILNLYVPKPASKCRGKNTQGAEVAKMCLGTGLSPPLPKAPSHTHGVGTARPPRLPEQSVCRWGHAPSNEKHFLPTHMWNTYVNWTGLHISKS